MGWRIGVLLSLLVVTGEVAAQRRGEVRSGPCPMSCRTLNIPKEVCRDWRDGTTCYVEDLRRPAADRPTAHRRGRVIVSNCPFNCASAGLRRADCRDWMEGNSCYVEDLTRAPGFEDRRPTPVPTRIPTTSRPQPEGNQAGVQECRRLDRIPPPRISIERVRPTGNYFGDKLKVAGTIEGICLVEAGAVQEGRRVRSIPIQTQRDFRRYDFEVVVEQGEYPEIRVWAINGERAIRPINGRGGEPGRYDPEEYDRYGGYGRGRPYNEPPPRQQGDFLGDILFGDQNQRR